MALFRSMGARPDDTRGTVPAEVRKALAGLVTGPGVLPGSSSPLIQGTTGFAYQVNRATWATPGGSGGGLHLWGNDGPLEIPTDPAPASGLSRIDIIYAVHPSATENGDSTSEPTVAVAKGVPASMPNPPTIPPRAIELGRNTMTSAATNTTGAGNTIAQTAPVARLVGTGTDADYEDTGWLIPTTQDGWSSISSVRSFRYRRRHGVVYLKGMVTGGTGITVAVLPPGFRPEHDKRLNVQNGDSGSNTIGLVLRADGYIQVAAGSTPSLDDVPPYPADK